VNGRALAVMACLAGCGTAAHRTEPVGRLDAEYLRGGFGGRAREVAATQLYRQVLARSLGTRCRMFPSDSQLYDVRAARCGATTAAALGIARLYLEIAAGPQLLPALIAEGRVRWLDLPRDCAP
jgi:hypothetical protein